MSPRILIVDDDENNREVLRDALDDEGYVLCEARDGVEALDAALAAPPDVILLDIMMPHMDGIECCRRLGADERTSHVPVILITALSDDEHVIKGLNVGATDYIAKPFAGPIVRARLRAALRSKLAHDELSERNLEVGQLAAVLAQKNRTLAELTDTAHRFVDNVAHEFRTPLAVIKEFSSIIIDGLGGPVTESQEEYLRFIEGATRDLSQMVDDFLDSSKLKARTLRVDRRATEAGQIIESVLPMLETRAAHKKCKVRTCIAGDLPPVFADGEKAGRVIVNLAINAIKFSPEGGVVEIRAEVDEDGGVRIAVADEGPGLSPDDMASVFKRFKQVGDAERSSTKGFGLGLNIARELIWLNLGTVDVRSVPGAGSTFSFTLPTDRPALMLDWYLERLAELDEPPVRLAALRVVPVEPSEDAERLRQFLVSVCYPMDLVIAAEDGRSILVVGSTAEPEAWMTRLRKTSDARGNDRVGFHARCVASRPFPSGEHLVGELLDALAEVGACA